MEKLARDIRLSTAFIEEKFVLKVIIVHRVLTLAHLAQLALITLISVQLLSLNAFCVLQIPSTIRQVRQVADPVELMRRLVKEQPHVNAMETLEAFRMLIHLVDA